MARKTTTQRGLGHAWQKLTRAAYARYGRNCHLQLPGCTGYADTIDHIVPRMIAGPTVPTLDDVRPACRHCNTTRGNKQRAALRRTHTQPPRTVRRRNWLQG
jgi:5-methylcytosine-specific restriction endonuclease McrA